MNQAVTEDGATYNKLRRPDDYLQSLTAQYPPKSELPPAKRKHEVIDTAHNDGDEGPNTKRPREGNTPKAGASSTRALAGDARRILRPVKENGMQTMFPGLDDDSASDADDTTRDALAYLRSVRSEASTIPTLLVAPPQAPKDDDRDRSMYNKGVGDHRAVYQDGMWVAVDHDAAGGYYDEDDGWSQCEEDIDPQVAYYKSLLGRYEALRNTLVNADPKELAVMVKADPEKYANVRVPHYKSDWRYAFDNKYPTPALVAQIDEKALYRALEYVAEVLTIGDTISKQKSCWIWTLLALAGESGTLDYYRVGRIRELGHKAGQLSIRLRSGERRNMSRDEEEEAEEWEFEGEGTDGGDDQDENETRERSKGEDNTCASVTQRQSGKDGIGNEDEEGYDPPTDIGSQADGTSERESEASPPLTAKKGPGDDSMTMSEDEGEIVDEESQDEDAPGELEAARARLLAQLGDNLVKDSIPDRKIPAHQLKANQQAHGEPRQGGRHRHNGKVCKDPSCHVNRKRQEAHRKVALRATQKNGGHDNNKSRKLSKSSQNIRPAENDKRQNAGEERTPIAENLKYLTADGPSENSGISSQANILAQPEDTAWDPTAIMGSYVALPEVPTPATFIASLDPALRRKVLMDMDEDVLQKLPPEFAAEARSYSNQVHEEDKVSGQQAPEAESEASSDSESDDDRIDAVDLNTMVTIDMILTVVGECYGQRDLLRFREAW